jgi:hypothetical protein
MGTLFAHPQARPAKPNPITSEQLARWLCNSIPVRDPEAVLRAFPGAGDAKIERTERRASTGRYIAYDWRMKTPLYRVTYGHQRRTDGSSRLYGFDLEVDGGTSDEAIVFNSLREAEQWLRGLGQPRRTQFPDHEVQVVARPIGDIGFGWEVTVDVEFFNVQVSWQNEEDAPMARGFCR